MGAIEWDRPWLTIYRAAATSILCYADWRAGLNERAAAIGVRNHRGLPLRFIPQSDLPPDIPYEAFISATGSVPTRHNLHDFFNGLVWLTFPLIKAELNRMQAEQIAVLGVGRERGATRDAATIFDENAALLITRNARLEGSLREHRWQDIFLRKRALFMRDTVPWLFGHALLEKLTAPYKAITGHALVIHAEPGFFDLPEAEKLAWVDRTVVQRLSTKVLTTAVFTPLPVLGVPGWWPGQEDAFYSDSKVFRAARGKSQHKAW